MGCALSLRGAPAWRGACFVGGTIRLARSRVLRASASGIPWGDVCPKRQKERNGRRETSHPSCRDLSGRLPVKICTGVWCTRGGAAAGQQRSHTTKAEQLLRRHTLAPTLSTLVYTSVDPGGVPAARHVSIEQQGRSVPADSVHTRRARTLKRAVAAPPRTPSNADDAPGAEAPTGPPEGRALPRTLTLSPLKSPRWC